MTQFEVDMALGQTPCLCGDCETWHPECFRGKSAEQVRAGYVGAYRKARRYLARRAARAANAVVVSAGARR